MKFKKKTLPFVFLVLLGLGLVFKLALILLISPSFLEELLEENLNCDASLESVRVSILRSEIRLRELALRGNDEDLSAIEVEELVLGVRILPLIGRRIETTSFVIRHPTLRMSVDEEGDLSLEELFSSPDDEEEKRSKNLSSPSSAKKREKRSALKAEDNEWLAKLEETRLEGGRVELSLEKEKLNLEIDELVITIRDLQFNPEDLATLNQVSMDIAGNCQLLDSEGELLVKLDLSGSAEGELFNDSTGDLDANVIADLALGEKSHVNPRVKVVRKTWELVEQVERIGIPLGELPRRVDFGRSRRVKGHYAQGVVTLLEPLSLSAGQWQLGLSGDSWIETFSSRHEIGVEFLAGEEVSDILGGWMSRLPSEAQGFVQERFVDQSQVLWRVNSSGDLDDPDLDFLSQLPETKGILDQIEDEFENEVDRLKEKAEGLLEGLFK